jgi:hypothetical protein
MPTVIGDGKDDDVAPSVIRDDEASQATCEVIAAEDGVAIQCKGKATLSHCMMGRE